LDYGHAEEAAGGEEENNCSTEKQILHSTKIGRRGLNEGGIVKMEEVAPS
jgi:hypothetical protein